MTYVLAAAFFAAWPFVYPAYSLPKLLVLSAGLAIVSLHGVYANTQRARTLDLPLAALIIVAVISTELSDDRYLSVFGRYKDWTQGLMGMTLAACFYWAYNCDWGKAWRDMRFLAWTGFAISALCIWQYFFAASQLPQGPWGPRAFALIGSPVDCGAILAATLPLAMATNRWLAVPIVLGIVSTGSRGALIAAACGLIYVGAVHEDFE